jgi:hypothetical protein
MNNTTITKGTLSLVAILMAATLVVGTFTTTTATQSAYAYNKKDNGKDGNGNGNTVTIQKCKQAAIQSGFDNNQGQECENVICTHPGENATCVQEEGAAAQTPPVKLSCEDCFRKFLSKTQLDKLIGQSTLEEACAVLSSGRVTLVGFENLLAELERVTGPIDIAGLIQCLRDAGIVFSTRGEA